MNASQWFVGLDLGQQSDPSALVAIEQTLDLNNVARYGIRHIHRWELGTGYPKIAEDTLNIINKLPPTGDPVLCIDSTGVGRAVVDIFKVKRDKLNARMVPITITAGFKASQLGIEWHVPKKDLVGVMQVLLGTRRLQVAPLPLRAILLKELATFKIKMNKATGNESFEAWRERDHDDVVLATAIAVWYALKGKAASPVGQFRILRDRTVPGQKKRILRIVVCGYDQLAKLEIDHNCLLFCLDDPPLPGEQETPATHAMNRLAGTATIRFIADDPDDHLQVWSNKLPPWNQTPDNLVMSQADGKRIWSMVTKKCDPAVEVIVIADNNEGRALSVAMAMVDVLGKQQAAVVKAADLEWKQGEEDEPPCRHVYQCTKKARGLVV